jgi:threonine-phosphate decarboxylase
LNTNRVTSSPLTELHLPAHGGQLRDISRHFGIPEEHLLDFSVNINPDGPPPSVFPALQRAVSDPGSLASYPDLEYLALRKSIGAHLNVTADCIFVGNGFIPLLQATLRTLGTHCCLLPVPAFSEYRASLQQAGMKVIPWPVESHGFRCDPTELLDTLERQTKLGKRCIILLANPQNPSGALTPAHLLNDLVNGAAQSQTTVLLDEAFIDYAPSESLARHAPSLPNLIVFRSVTKFYAIPSLRVAYAVGSPRNAQRITRFISPWSISTLAADAASAALSDLGFAEQARERNATRRLCLASQLALLGLHIYPSGANFLLLRLPSALGAETVWRNLIAREHVLTRSCANFESLSPNHLRVSVRRTAENTRLVEALRRVIDRHSA